jgi:hypothetical protein
MGRASTAALGAMLSFVTSARAASPCEPGAERVVAYSVSSDRYAVREEAGGQGRRRFLVVRISTGELLDRVACASAARCDLTDAFGLGGCSYAAMPSAHGAHGLTLARSATDAGTWTLGQENKGATVPLLSVKAAGELEVRTVRIVGRRVLVVLQERGLATCPGSTAERIILLDEEELRPGRARVERTHALVDFEDLGSGDAGERAAPVFRPAPGRLVVRAARTAAAAGLDRLAACWIQHNAAAMSVSQRGALYGRLARDPVLSHLAGLAVNPVRTRASAARGVTAAATRAR